MLLATNHQRMADMAMTAAACGLDQTVYPTYTRDEQRLAFAAYECHLRATRPNISLIDQSKLVNAISERIASGRATHLVRIAAKARDGAPMLFERFFADLRQYTQVADQS